MNQAIHEAVDFLKTNSFQTYIKDQKKRKFFAFNLIKYFDNIVWFFDQKLD